MKLVVKMPEGKPPLIGIEFKDFLESNALNDDLVELHKYAVFRVVFEFQPKWLNVKLICQEALIIRHYTHVKYDDLEKLKVWLYLTKKHNQFNFCHFYVENGKEKLVKTYKKKMSFLLSVAKYDYFGIDDLKPKEAESDNKTSWSERRWN